MESYLLLAMNVHSLFVGPAMSMKEEKETKLAPSVKPDINVLKVALVLRVMKKKMILMILTMNLSMETMMPSLIKSLKECPLLAMVHNIILLQSRNVNPLPLVLKSLS
uniref:Uncharacterized protein n=1 Tax=Cannabis sativa TaxID=3483 RepID=A0A803QZX2_CANSA